MKKWEEYFNYKKQGREIIITHINPIRNLSDEVIPNMAGKELIERYGTEEQISNYQIAAKENNRNKKNYIKNSVLKEGNRYADINYNKETKLYEVDRVYKYLVPKRMVYMKKGMYQYMIPSALKILLEEGSINKESIKNIVKDLGINKQDQISYYTKQIYKYINSMVDIESTTLSSREQIEEYISYFK